MIVSFSNKINLIFPLNLFNSEYFMFKTKFIILKYIFKKPNISFIKSIKFITNNYYNELKIFKRIIKKNLITRNNLSKSTKKPWTQKGLGKARSGSFKSPLWRGGSILFGPVNRTLKIYLYKKNKKLTLFYLIINKRTYISFVLFTPLIHNFNTILNHLNQQKRIKGLFSNKLVYILMYNFKNIFIKNYFLKSINSLNFSLFLKFEYIIFLI